VTTTRGFGVAAVVLVVVGWLFTRAGLPPYDDAFFFVRFARNTLSHGVPAWNVSDGPVHGNTSQLMQAWATAVAALAPDHVIALTRALLAASLAAAVWLSPRRDVGVVVLLGPVALSTLTTGMETALAIGLGAAFLASLRHNADGFAPLPVLLGVLAYLCRPDTGLLTVGTLLARRRRAEAAALLLGVGACLLAFTWLYGQPLPTAFATKLGLNEAYDATFLARSREAKLRHLLFFAWCLAPVLPAMSRRPAWPEAGIATAFVAWHTVFTTDVMGMHARFLAPVLPWVVAAAAAPPRGDTSRHRGVNARQAPGVSLPSTLESLPGSPAAWTIGWAATLPVLWLAGAVPTTAGWAIGQVSPWSYAGHIAAVAWIVTGRGWQGGAGLVAAGVLLSAPPATDGRHPTDVAGRAMPWRPDRAHVDAYADMVTSFRGLDAVEACLGTDLTAWHSELGVIGMVLSEGHITDLGGLMHPPIPPDDLDAACIAAEPDLVFLPHRNYRQAHRALRRGRCLAGYRRVIERSSSPLFVHPDHLSALAPCLGRHRGETPQRLVAPE